MAGRTGKLTAEALALRGPRFALVRCPDGKLAITLETTTHDYPVLSKSFSVSYLKKVKKGNEMVF